MKYGTGFPHVALDSPAAASEFGIACDSAGFDYVTTNGHLLGAEAGRYPNRVSATYAGPFHDPFVLFAFLAGQTTRLHFFTSILILPLYETAIVARQAAELAFVSGGRFELGVGLSWQEAEYNALGQDLHRRGARLAEQVEVLRLFWSKPYFSFKGRFHDIDNLGLARVPAFPIPVWFGSSLEEKPMRRAAALGDGWMPMADPAEPLPRFRQYMTDAGRDPATLKLMSRVVAGEGGAEAWIAEGRRLQSIGTTHLTIGAPPDLHGAEAMQRVIEARKSISDVLG